MCVCLQVLSLKKCGISDDPADYYLVDLQDSPKEERELSPDEQPYNIPPKSHGILRLYIRYARHTCHTHARRQHACGHKLHTNSPYKHT